MDVHSDLGHINIRQKYSTVPRAQEWVSAAGRANAASSAEQENEWAVRGNKWAVRGNERVDERVTHY